jgi:hypothetical protein
VYLIGFILVCSALYLTGKHLFGTKGDMNTGNNGKILGTAIAVTIVLSQLRAWFGECIPGSWFERSRYTTEIYVNLFPDGSESKNYRVPALIEADFDEYDDGERTDSYRVYRLRHVTFPNGGRASFDNNDETLKLGKRVSVRDDESRWWRVELTADRAPKPK